MGLSKLTRVFYTSVHRDDRTARVELGHPLALPCASLVELEVRVATGEELGHRSVDRFLKALAAEATLPADATLPWALVGLEQHSRLARLRIRADRLTLDPTHLLCELGALRKLTLNARHLIASGRASSPSPCATRVSRIRQLKFSGTAAVSTIQLSPTEFPDLELLTIGVTECDLSVIVIPRSTVYWLRLRGPDIVILESARPWPGAVIADSAVATAVPDSVPASSSELRPRFVNFSRSRSCTHCAWTTIHDDEWCAATATPLGVQVAAAGRCRTWVRRSMQPFDRVTRPPPKESELARESRNSFRVTIVRSRTVATRTFFFFFSVRVGRDEPPHKKTCHRGA